jgi:hypothetical protein
MNFTLRAIVLLMTCLLCERLFACEWINIKRITPNPACVGTSIAFEADPLRTRGTPRWNFDCVSEACSGGPSAVGMTVHHSYDLIGGYLITARVTDTGKCGETAITSGWVCVTGVWSVSAGGVVSYTSTPGEAETVYVAKRPGRLTIGATPYFGWPTSKPVWSSDGDLADIGEGPDVRGLSTVDAGWYNVTATCGDTSKKIRVCVIEVNVTCNKEGTCVEGDVAFTAGVMPSGLSDKTVWEAEGGIPSASQVPGYSFGTYWMDSGTYEARVTVAGVASASKTVRVACPVNLRSIPDRTEMSPDGTMIVWYTWDSSSGNMSDLAGLRISEFVDYPGTDPCYVWPRPWDDWSTTHTQRIGGWTAYDPPWYDNQYMGKMESSPPTIAGSFDCTQRYVYWNQSKDDHDWPLLGPHTISRSISNDGGIWTYTCTKHGQSKTHQF